MFKAALASLLLTCTFCAHAGTTVDVSRIYGKIQFVDSYPDYKIQIVDSYPDFTIEYVESWPGVN